MVVGGYSNYRERLDPNTGRCLKDEDGNCVNYRGLIKDVELLNLSKEKNFCSQFVNPIFGNSYVVGEDELGLLVENEAELLGMTGVFSKDAAIVCGGKNGDGDQNACYEWDSNINEYVIIFA